MAFALASGFSDPVLSAQSTFRCIMDATARPTKVLNLSETVTPPRPLSRGAGAVALTLFDQDTPVWLDAALADQADVAFWLRFHTRAPIVKEQDRAAFAIVSQPDRAPPFEAFALGTPDYPDRAATLILQVDSFERGRTFAFAGPGINGQSTLRATPLPPDFSARLVANRALFPRGVDLLLVADDAIVALPRSVKLIDEA
jgi:alpha-D-ribose 1-methylphosphonate 5-triphosphate synthase subunit PhnH